MAYLVVFSQSDEPRRILNTRWTLKSKCRILNLKLQRFAIGAKRGHDGVRRSRAQQCASLNGFRQIGPPPVCSGVAASEEGRTPSDGWPLIVHWPPAGAQDPMNESRMTRSLRCLPIGIPSLHVRTE